MAYDLGPVTVIGEGEAEAPGRWVRLLPARWDLHYYPWWKSTTVECIENIPDCTGKTVIDFGCGATAIIALAAARMGASRVIAIDRQASLIEEAKRQVEANDLSAVVECIVATEPTEQVDYMIANVGDAVLVGEVSRWAAHGHGTDHDGNILRW